MWRVEQVGWTATAPVLSSRNAPLHELASPTTGRRPPPVQRQSASAVLAAISACACGCPFEAHGVPQQWPGASGGIQTGLRARAERATSASMTVGASVLDADAGTPKMRFTHAGR